MPNNDKKGPLVLISAAIGFALGLSAGKASSEIALEKMSQTILDLHQTPAGHPDIAASMITLGIVSGCAVLGACLIPLVVVFTVTKTRRIK